MDRYKVGPVDQIGTVDRIWSKPQMRYGYRARLLGIIHKISLGVVWGFLPDDLDRIFIRTDGSIRAKPPEYRPHLVLGSCLEARVVLQAGEGDVVPDTHGEMVLGRRLCHFVKHALHHRRRELL